MSNYSIIINTFTDKAIGRYNVTFVDNSGTVLANTFGAGNLQYNCTPLEQVGLIMGIA